MGSDGSSSRVHRAVGAPYVGPSVTGGGPGRVLQRVSTVPGGIAFRCRPYWRNAEAVLTAEGLQLRHGGIATSLPWGGEWRFERFGGVGGRGDQFGVGVRDAGAAEALWGSWSLPLRLMPPRRRRTMVPIQAMTSMFNGATNAVAVLEALRNLLRDDADAAAALGLSDPAAQLARDLRRWTSPWAKPLHVKGRHRDEIAATIARLGYVHPTGRPYPGWTGDANEVIGHVGASLAANPYARNLGITSGEISSVVHAQYLDRPPWPFVALLDGR